MVMEKKEMPAQWTNDFIFILGLKIKKSGKVDYLLPHVIPILLQSILQQAQFSFRQFSFEGLC